MRISVRHADQRQSQPGQPHECELRRRHADRREPDRGRSAGGELHRDWYGTGITAAQLYSTASYQAHDLTGIGLDGNNLAGVNLAGQNLTNANFRQRHADQCQSQPGQPHQCEFSGVLLWRMWQLPRANLSSANLSQANLTNANFCMPR